MTKTVFHRTSLSAALIAAISGVHIAPANAAQAFELEEIMVTATRRAQSVEDIPYNISAVSGDAIANAGVSDLQSLTRMIPGLTSADLGPRASGINSNLIIRGLNTNSSAASSTVPNLTVPLVSTYVDETPMFVNLKLHDIERVEVLRGPQGTLYGSGSMGGTLRLIHRKPDSQETTADVSGKLSFTDDSSEQNYSVDGVFNLPLSEDLALRIGLGYEEVGGFIDASQLATFDANGQPLLASPEDPLNSGLAYHSAEDVDSADLRYLRSSLLWNINDDVEALFTYHRQEENSDDYSVQTTGLNNEHNLAISSPLEREVDLVSVDISADVGFASFSSSTSYYDNESQSLRDGTGFMENVAASPVTYGGFPRVLSSLTESARDRSLTQEFRLVSNGDGDLDWVVGAFYRDQRLGVTMQPQLMHGFAAWADLPGSGAVISDLFGAPGAFDSFADFIMLYNGAPRPSDRSMADYVFGFDREVSFEDLAVFGELTYHITDAWQMTVGMRQFWQDFEQELTQQLPICGPYCSSDGLDPSGTLTVDTAADFEDAIYKFNSSYDLNENTMVYFTWAEGFRHGGANGLAIGDCGLCEADGSLLTFDSDNATNIEAGVKGRLGDTTSYTFSLYNIDWQDVQLDAFTDPGAFPFVINGGDARSRGLELEINTQLTENLSAVVGYGYVDAELRDDFVVERTVGEAGNRLPGVPEHQLSLSLDYFKQLDSGMELHLHLDGFYRDQVTTTVSDKIYDSAIGQVVVDTSQAGFTVLDDFQVWNLSANLSGDRWRAGLFVNNLGNEDGVSGQILDQSQDYNRQYISRPRTVGVSFGYRWE
ncbi:TonB-dependent receptor [Pseudomaricurvus alkylphenolicus]|uniref:TonB-dependent receptor n=1 Tax=Pseudomaricurvus alkylphenolicus TaxID=1306991 RepID=UPI00142042C2|nr:TonB-dependent receptor [Pseudomaricurvus alkylphenolicus]NIB42959.1 TonB-dependent receptor [Pseudomaricurvus alkylphenolicus]